MYATITYTNHANKGSVCISKDNFGEFYQYLFQLDGDQRTSILEVFYAQKKNIDIFASTLNVISCFAKGYPFDAPNWYSFSNPKNMQFIGKICSDANYAKTLSETITRLSKHPEKGKLSQSIMMTLLENVEEADIIAKVLSRLMGNQLLNDGNINIVYGYVMKKYNISDFYEVLDGMYKAKVLNNLNMQKLFPKIQDLSILKAIQILLKSPDGTQGKQLLNQEVFDTLCKYPENAVKIAEFFRGLSKQPRVNNNILQWYATIIDKVLVGMNNAGILNQSNIDRVFTQAVNPSMIKAIGILMDSSGGTLCQQTLDVLFAAKENALSVANSLSILAQAGLLYQNDKSINQKNINALSNTNNEFTTDMENALTLLQGAQILKQQVFDILCKHRKNAEKLANFFCDICRPCENKDIGYGLLTRWQQAKELMGNSNNVIEAIRVLISAMPSSNVSSSTKSFAEIMLEFNGDDGKLIQMSKSNNSFLAELNKRNNNASPLSNGDYKSGSDCKADSLL